jgi:hypothetical protein
MLLRALELELHAWVKIRQEKYLIKDNVINNLTINDFMAICNEAINKGCLDSKIMYASNSWSKIDKSNKSAKSSTLLTKTDIKKSR